MATACDVNNFTIEDMHFQIAFSTCALIFNFLSFITFYFNSKTRKSILAKLMMIMCLCESICYYCIFIVINDLPSMIDKMNIRPIFSFLTFNNYNQTQNVYQNYTRCNNSIIIGDENYDVLTPSINWLMKINNSIYSMFLTFSLILHISYAFEVICIFRYPISDFSKRANLYVFIASSLAIFSFVSNYFYLFEFTIKSTNTVAEIGYNKMLYLFWESQDFNFILLICFLITGFLSMLFMINILCTKSKFYSGERIFFCFRHISYILIYITFWTYPAITIRTGDINSIPVRNSIIL